MHFFNFRRFSVASQLSLFAVILLIFGVFVALNSSQKKQETRSRADTSTLQPTQTVCSGLVVTRALMLDKTSITFGDTISGKITYSNPCTVPIDVKSVMIGGKTSTQAAANFSGGTGVLTVLPGQMVSVEGLLTIAVGDPVGSWIAFGMYQDSDGAWHSNGASVGFDVVKAIVVTPNPTIPIVTPSNTRIGLTLLLDGIGNGGDRSNPAGKGNFNPNRKDRTVSVELFDDQNKLVKTQIVPIKFDSSKGVFATVADFGVAIPSGFYTVKVKVDQYLKAVVPGIQTLTAGQVNNLPTTILIAGDINGDNQTSIVDYNLLMGCYSDLLPAASCDDQKKSSSDINDDGVVNQFDYNLFLRELNNRGGD